MSGRRSARSGPEVITVLLLLVLGAGAVAGGAMLVIAPDGSAVGFSPDLLAGSPFGDFLIPGLTLLGLFGIGSIAVAAAGLRHAPWAPFGAFAIGIAQMIWIVVELVVIHELSFLHPAMFTLGLSIAAGATAWGWPSLARWRHSHRPSRSTRNQDLRVP